MHGVATAQTVLRRNLAGQSHQVLVDLDNGHL